MLPLPFVNIMLPLPFANIMLPLPLSIYRIAITHYHLYSTIHYHCQPLSRLYSVTSIHTMPKLGGHYLLSTLCSPLHFSYIRQLPPLSKLAATTLGNIIWPETFVNNVKSMQPPLTLWGHFSLSALWGHYFVANTFCGRQLCQQYAATSICSTCCGQHHPLYMLRLLSSDNSHPFF